MTTWYTASGKRRRRGRRRIRLKVVKRNMTVVGATKELIEELGHLGTEIPSDEPN